MDEKTTRTPPDEVVSIEPRVAIGPGNVAGQAREWARSVRAEGIDCFSFAGNVGRSQALLGRTDRRIPHHRMTPATIRRGWVGHILRDRTHVISESMVAVLGNPQKAMLDEEAAHWRMRGVALAAIFHGSDIRDPAAHLARIPSSYFREASPAWVRDTAAQAQHRRDVFRSLGIRGFVSTPDLLLDLPETVWCPVVVDLDAWACAPSAFASRLRVLHLPSRRVPPIKGTTYVDRVLGRLHAEDLIEYVHPDFVPHDSIPDLIESVDVVVDQILSGSYGVAAVEAMAAGRVVVGNVAADVRALVPADIPIVDATPDTLESVIRNLSEDRDPTHRMASEGPEFVRRIHDGGMSGAAIRSWVMA